MWDNLWYCVLWMSTVFSALMFSTWCMCRPSCRNYPFVFWETGNDHRFNCLLSFSFLSSCWTWRCLSTRILTSASYGGWRGTLHSVGVTSAASSNNTISLWSRRSSSTSNPWCNQLTSWYPEVGVLFTYWCCWARWSMWPFYILFYRRR